ncbi:hypothetical protein [Aeoliella sp.]|uniref:hypothetical protein n=1 Tax=Aeoliella sp. TaxID=2795800 RepID=UPI003CCC28F5
MSLNTPDAVKRSTAAWSWLLLLKTPAIALRGRVVALAAAGVVLVWACDQMLGTTTSQPSAEATGLAGFAASTLHTLQFTLLSLADPFIGLTQGEPILVNLLRCAVRLVVWALLGGAIVRITALALTRDESPDVDAAVLFAWRQRSGFLGGPLLLLAGLAFMLLPLVVVRLAMEISWLSAVVAVIWPVVIVVAVLVALYAIAAAIGWPLLWAATAVDGSDSFDAVSRMFAYAYQKPLRLLGYAALVLAMAVGCSGAASAFAIVAAAACDFATGTPDNQWAQSVIAGWNSIALGLIGVYLTALIWTSATGIYLLRRQDVDGVHTDEVFIDPNEYDGGIPQLREGPTGVPEFDDQSDAA